MTRLFLITLLVLSRGPVYAEWVSIGSSEGKGGVTMYVDRDTIRRNGNLVKIWVLEDFKTIQTVGGVSHLSGKRQMQYECAEERFYQLAITRFSGNMGNGNAGYSGSEERKWEPVEPESVGQALWEFAYGKK